jgi:hypothetical protein
MQAMREVTVWDETFQPNHVYLMDGDNAHAYIPFGTGAIFKFKKPLKLDTRRRQFKVMDVNPFAVEEITQAHIRIVEGSKGKTYRVDTILETCSCPGFRFRGHCKHL